MRLFDKLLAANRWDSFTESAGGIAANSVRVIAIDAVCDHAMQEFDTQNSQHAIGQYFNPDWSRYPFATPPLDLSFVEANMPPSRGPSRAAHNFCIFRQFGSLVWSVHRKDIPPQIGTQLAGLNLTDDSQLYCLKSYFVDDREKLYAAQYPLAILGINGLGSITGVKFVFAGMTVEQAREISAPFTFFAETTLLAFTFINCSNVKLDDVTDELQPSPKIRRRLGIPEVKRYTLNIAGHVARPSREYDQGPQGVMPFHLCRGHFATYTADKPMFGNPKLVGRYWHPPHMKGKKENGEIIKDYAIKDQVSA